MSLIKVTDASFSYSDRNGRKGSKTKVFENIGFEIGQGEIFCVVGPNGCGKSTLIDCLLGLNKLDSGKIEVAGKSVYAYKPKQLAEHIAYVPQNHKHTFGYTVLDIVAMGRTWESNIFNPATASEKEHALRSLELVGLSGFAERDYTKLSGGELQLVLIARALCQEAEVLIMDEPTAHLDFRHELDVMEIIARLVKEQGVSIVMATHFLNQAFFLENANVNTKVALMSNRTFAKTGSPTDVLNEENLKDVFGILTEVSVAGNGGRKFIIPLKNAGQA